MENKLFAVRLFTLVISAVFYISSTGFNLASAQQDEEWWFDVEIAIFKRSQTSNLNEDFSAGNFDFQQNIATDLLSLPILRNLNPLHGIYLAVPSCNPSTEPDTLVDVEELTLLSPQHNVQQALDDADTMTFDRPIDEIDSAEPETTETANIQNETETELEPKQNLALFSIPEAITDDISIGCVDDYAVQGFESVPTRVFNNLAYVVGQNLTVGESDLHMQKYVDRVFKQPDVKPLLYTIWRQQVVFGEDNADFIKVFAGNKLNLSPADEVATEVDETFLEAEEQSISTVLNDIAQSLENAPEIDWLSLEAKQEDLSTEQQVYFNDFELSGLFKVYLEYVGSIPYLNITAEFKHYKVDIDSQGQAYLEVYPFKQRRRIISRQIHYFDHPAFGIVVRLNRYTPPVNQVEGLSE
ncbi:CsiV family protein [Glaciecola sp. 1036]|uniref:CsiV family protein n=1 Tax=Alteromonadaceae TaxID=72275 RepID=UPI003D0608BB